MIKRKKAMRTAAFILILANMISDPGAAQAQSQLSADLVVLHANVYTVNPAQPRAQAVAVIGERIVAVGNNSDIERWRGAQTKVIDARGRLVLPGFNDAHLHFVSGGAQLGRVQLYEASSVAEFKRRLSERAANSPKGEWILGGDWDETKWRPSELPTAKLIDDAAQTTPVFISRYDGHAAAANSLAMKLAGVDKNTKDVPGGVIVRDAHGRPTGLFKDAAQTLITKAIPPMSRRQRMEAARRALAYAASLGVTSVQTMNPEYADIEVFSELAERGELTARIYAAPMEQGWADQARLGLRRAFGSTWLRIGVLKGYADGSLGSETAYMFEPYRDDPKNFGILSDEMQPPEAMLERLMRADAAGLQICVHAIGDRANSMTLDMFEAIEKAHGCHDQRFRIEHAQHVAPGDFARFGRLRVIASMQPYHAIDDGRWADARIGPKVARYSYAWRSMLDHGVTLAFGTDWDVAPLDPMIGLYAAVTRATLDGKRPNGWIPEEKITLAEAIYAYTVGSAIAEFQEKEKGAIGRGKLADMVVVDRDLFTINPDAIKDAKIAVTIVGGKVVFTADESALAPIGQD